MVAPDITDSEFRVSISLDIPGEEEDDPPKFLLQVKYPEDYPDVAPDLALHAEPGATPHELFSITEDREQLLAGLEETIQENLGMAMIFQLASALKEGAEKLIQDRKDAAAKVQEEKAMAAEREENKKFQGTPVTPETFMKWREDFLKEMEEKRQQEEEERLAELKKARVKEPVKLTGKQLWERGLVGKGDELDDEDDDAPTESIEKLKVAAA